MLELNRLMRKFFIGIALLCAFLSAASSFAEIERTVVLRPTADIASQEVCIGDLINESWLKSRCAVDRKTCCLWNLDGVLSKSFSRMDLQATLDRVDFGGIRIKIDPDRSGDTINVTQTRRALGEDEIRAKIIESIATKLGVEGEEKEFIRVPTLRAGMPVLVPIDAPTAWNVVLPDPITDHATIKITNASGDTVLGWVNAQLSHRTPVYVAKKAIKPNEMITAEVFDLTRAEMFGASAQSETPFLKGAFPTGVRAKLSILAGSPLYPRMIERVPIVQLGDVVTIILKSDSLRISTKGVVQNAAGVGEMVTVQLQRYNKTFRGKLSDNKSVEVWF